MSVWPIMKPGRDAWISACGTWRYGLSRDWGEGSCLAAVLLNPSTADAERDDATLVRMVGRARAGGFGRLVVVNLFALRATDPAALRRAADPVGPENDAAILAAVQGAGMVLCGWGSHGDLRGRGTQVEAMLRARGHGLWHLGLTQSGAPRHPLYVPKTVGPRQWEAEAR
jgi:hypothetical protein